jgi:hypothetical protein
VQNKEQKTIPFIYNRPVEEQFTENPTIKEFVQKVKDKIRKEKRNEE